MSAVALQNLLDYLLSALTANNRKWLAEHLLQASQDELRIKQENEVRESLCKAFRETQQCQARGEELPNAYDLLEEL